MRVLQVLPDAVARYRVLKKSVQPGLVFSDGFAIGGEFEIAADIGRNGTCYRNGCEGVIKAEKRQIRHDHAGFRTDSLTGEIGAGMEADRARATMNAIELGAGKIVGDGLEAKTDMIN